MCHEATLNQIIQAVRELPEARAAEVLDFAHFLQTRQTARDTLGDNFEQHFGSLKSSPLFQGRDPVAIQREMRDEWR